MHSPQTVRSFAVMLRELAKDPAVGPLGASQTSVEPLGAALTFEPRGKRRTRANAWFLETALHERQTAGLEFKPLFDDVDIGLVVHWPTLLRGATYARPTVLRPQLHAFLRLVVDLVEQYDFLLSETIRCAHALWLSRGEPADQGLDDPKDQERFDRHLVALLDDEAFLAHLLRTVDATLDGFTRPARLPKVAACDTHDAREVCPGCAPMAWLRRRTTVLRASALMGSVAHVSLRLVRPQIYPDTLDPWQRDVRYLLAGTGVLDGVVPVAPPQRRLGNQVLVNWGRLAVQWKRLGRASPVMGVVGEDPAQDPTHAGHRARLLFAERTKSRHVAHRVQSISEIVRESTGSAMPDREEVAYEIYGVASLMRSLDHYGNRVAAAKRARESLVKSTRGPTQRRYLARTYVDTKGQEHVVFVIRRRRQIHGPHKDKDPLCMYTLPFAIDEDAHPHPSPRNQHWSDGRHTFWTAQGINGFATMRGWVFDRNRETGEIIKRSRRPSDEYVYPEAAPFLNWVDAQDALLRGDGFAQAMYEQRYPDRIAAKARGDRKHLGFFVSAEDDSIRAFFDSRSGGELTADEWAKLRDQLPGRSDVSISRRRDQLAFEYAARRGYKEYAASGWCERESKKRRRKWRRMGVGP